MIKYCFDIAVPPYLQCSAAKYKKRRFFVDGLEKATLRVKEFRKREQLILDTALKLFLEQDEDKVTVETIADAVGIGKGTIYKHFTSKQEIYVLLLIRYEEELAGILQNIQPDDDKDRLVREYFQFRMADPARYALFDRLEKKCAQDESLSRLIERLHEIRESNVDQLETVIKARIAEGKLADVPPYFHIAAAWALVHGAVGLCSSEFYKDRIEDKEGFFSFLMDAAVKMGNRSRLKNVDEQEME